MSTFFSVDTEALKRDADRLNEIGSSVGSQVWRLNEVENDLRFDFSKYGGVISALETCKTNTGRMRDLIYRCSSVCRQSAFSYENTEDRIIMHMDNELFAFAIGLWEGLKDWFFSLHPIILNPLFPFLPPFILPSIGEIGSGLDLFLHRLLPYDDSENGDLSLSRFGGKTGIHGTIFGMEAGVDGEYHVAHLTTESESGAEWNLDEGEAGIEYKRGIGFSAVDGKAAYNVGPYSGEVEAKVGNVAAAGGIGISLMEDGQFDPHAYVGVEGKASVAEGTATGQLGSDSYNVHSEASGTLLGAEAEAKLQLGSYTDKNGNEKFGVSTDVGAEAYVAEGELSGGFTFMGIKFDAGIEGKAGGAGAKVGGEVSSSGVSGEIGAGLGLGLGLNVSVDWSDFKWEWPW